MTDDSLKQTSKFLSYLLRHNPAALQLDMDASGWVAIAQITARSKPPVTRAEIEEAVRRNNKQRFSISACGTFIRANQGHSIDVDLGLEPALPPDLLFHGTAQTSVTIILQEGLLPMQRQHVHLSSDTSTARQVGMRHGKPVILQVDAAKMQLQGHKFYMSENRVWLCKTVPPEFLELQGPET
ncbi:RNA 2'-phosphotransferase [Leisingera sp. ANG-Vp]|uniref:RNA 2'-phosphotransferase n=1 Tax=Leisingera sp. ANG-Vp TaxID=1577896 RepID=UPI00057C710A|nr:RNA 2'-phosphotransferase [Leisingera sp. ANG-Vp]KIC18501.1 RNA 2'-phosphotransferase [Leisingera sp. ANG-Vp]